MKTIKTIQNLTLKDGTAIPANSSLTFIRHSEMSSTCGLFSFNGKELKLRYRNIIKNPSMKSLERWSNGSIAKSVFGATCEPDGHGTHGEPSWLLAMGLI